MMTRDALKQLIWQKVWEAVRLNDMRETPRIIDELTEAIAPVAPTEGARPTPVDHPRCVCGHTRLFHQQDWGECYYSNGSVPTCACQEWQEKRASAAAPRPAGEPWTREALVTQLTSLLNDPKSPVYRHFLFIDRLVPYLADALATLPPSETRGQEDR